MISNNIIDRTEEVEDKIRKTWSPSVIRTRFVLNEEKEIFNNMYDSLTLFNQSNRIVDGQKLTFMTSWVKSRLTSLGKDYEVGSIMFTDQEPGPGAWWFGVNPSIKIDGSYDPTVIPYKLVIVPLQVNHSTDENELAKITFYTTNYHYIRNNVSTFLTTSSKLLQHRFDVDGDLSKETPIWYKKYEFSKYNNEEDKILQENNLDIETHFSGLTESVLILDATRIYGFKIVNNNYHYRFMSIMTYKN